MKIRTNVRAGIITSPRCAPPPPPPRCSGTGGGGGGGGGGITPDVALYDY